MRRQMLRLTWIAVTLVMVTWTAAGAAGPPTVVRSVVAGGGQLTEAGDYRLRATVGEGIVGPAGPIEDYQVTAGYWAGIPNRTQYQYLPAVRK